MNQLTKIILAIVLMVAVIGYTVFNYISGKIDLVYFLVCVAIVGLPLANMINIMIRELKDK